MKTHIKLYGLQRTGTNYCMRVLHKNFDARVKVLDNGLGWKHGPTVNPESWIERRGKLLQLKGKTRAVPVLLLTKNPLAWFVSYAKYYGWLGQWEDFQQLVRCTMNNYTAIQRNWLDMMHHFYDSVKIIRFEDFLGRFQAAMGDIATWADVEVEEGHVFRNIDNEVRPVGVTKNSFSDRRRYYEQQKYMRHVPAELKELILDSTSTELLERLGYTAEGEWKGSARA